jgi:ribonuclease III
VGPDHEKTFEVAVVLGTDVYARATGRSKKDAEQTAARATLEMLGRGEKPGQEPPATGASEASGPAPVPSLGPKGDTPT